MPSPFTRSSPTELRAHARVRRVGLIASLVILIALLFAIFTGQSAASTRSAKHADVIGQPRGVMWDGSSRTGVAPGASSVLRSLLSPLARFGPASALVTCPQPQPDPGCNMTYHNGPLVIGPHTAYIVYWDPSSSLTSNYRSLLNRYETDVAADSGRATNVYATDTQYDDSTNTFIQYNITFGGSFVDTTAYPATKSGCPLTDGTNTVTNCLDQTQESTELDNFIQTSSLPRGINTIYFLVLPKTVETCNDAHTSCGNWLNTSPNRYCAYHSSFNISSHGLTLWGNEPYINTGAGHCDSGSRSTPNGNIDAEAAINALSHEHNETITDPTGGGWFDVDGTGENGDKCNTIYGPAIGQASNGQDYNQLINHNTYETQQEWSNAITGCASNYGAVDPTAAFTFSPASPKALDPVSFDGTGSHSNNTGGYIIDYSWTFGDGGTGSGATPSHTYAASGTYTVQLTVKDDAGLTNSVSHSVTVVTRATVTTYTGATSGDYHDSVTLSAHLKDSATSAALSGKLITFDLGTQSCSDSTDGSGDASCSITLTQIPGSYTVKASFAGDSVYTASNDSTSFTIEKEETTLTYTGPTVILAGASGATLTATLVEDGANDDDNDGGSPAPDPSGQTVTFTLGSQSCSDTTDSSGTASCTISSVSSSTLGSKTLTTSFAGDDYYLGSSDSDQVTVFAFPSRGAFTLGNLTVAAATPSTVVNWWNDSWSLFNTLTGGTAPISFKGFAGTVATLPSTSPANVCGTTFTTLPGNSPPPTSGVPSYMGVLVASSVTKSGNAISGTWGKIVVVQVNTGYAPSPGHPGTGTIVATFCP